MEPLSDPKNNRQVPSVKPPPGRPLSSELIWDTAQSPNVPNWKALRDHLKRDGIVQRQDVVKLIELSAAVLKGEGNLIYTNDPITVVGDIHGQFHDMLKLLSVGGEPENTKYLFLGDFVDRGCFSLEVMLLVMALKVRFATTIFVLRGNHECRQMTSSFNFRTEILTKYDQEVYAMFMDLMDCMPLSAVINGKFIAFHGGISPELRTLNDINKLDRFKEPPKSGLIW